MTTASGCARKCRLHTKFGWHLPCHYCVTSHVPASRSAHGQTPAVRSGSAEDIRGLTEGPEPGTPDNFGPSPLQGDSVEPGTPLSGSAVALSGSRSTAGDSERPVSL